LEAARVALKSNPASPELLNFVELLHHKAAEAAQNDFQVELAEHHLLESISLARDMLRLRPEHYGSLMNISVAQLRLGGLSNSKGDVSSAKNYFLQALETQQALVSKHPDDTLLKLNLLDTYRALNSLTGDRNYLRDARPIAQMLLSEGQLTPAQVQLATGMLERSEPE
jgi:tetratricopeptide (TPR) repeat protein